MNIAIHRYKNPKAIGYAAAVEPADRSWIAFVDLEGRPRLFARRDPVSGTVLPDDPDERGACEDYIAHDNRRRMAWERGEPAPSDEIAPPIAYHPEVEKAGRYVGKIGSGGMPMPPAWDAQPIPPPPYVTP